MKNPEAQALTQNLIDRLNTGAQDPHERTFFLVSAMNMLKAEFDEASKAESVEVSNMIMAKRERIKLEAAAKRLAEDVRAPDASVIPSKKLAAVPTEVLDTRTEPGK